MKRKTINRLLSTLLTFALAVGEIGSTGISAFAAGEETVGEGVYDDALISSDEETDDPTEEEDMGDADDEGYFTDPADDGGEEGVAEDDTIDDEEVPDDASDSLIKNTSNTLYGTSGMSNPRVPTSEEDEWQGSYVYYGQWDGGNGTWVKRPLKFRVLDRYSTVFNPYKNSVLLDCESILFPSPMDTRNNGDWSDALVREDLNGDDFLDSGVFTLEEKNSIIESIKNKPDVNDGSGEGAFGVLHGEKIFILDERESKRPSYGYSDYKDGIEECNNRKKTGSTCSFNDWWTRSRGKSGVYRGISNKGKTFYFLKTSYRGVSPAFNVNLSSVLFSTAISGTKGELGTEYKFTLLDINADTEDTIDDGLQISTTRKSPSIIGRKVTVPYSIGGTAASEANAVSVLILDSPYQWAHTGNPTVLYYDRLDISRFSQNGTGEFTLPDSLDPEKWDTDYFVYIIAEDINGTYETDYASAPHHISKGSLVEEQTVTVTFDLQGHGDSSSSYYQPRTVEKGARITEPVEPSVRGWKFKGWYTSATDHSSAAIFNFNTPVNENLTLYAYWAQQYKVSFDLTEGTSRSNTLADQHVAEGDKVVRPAPDPQANGLEFDNWYDNKARTGAAYDFNTPVTGEMTLYASWKKATTYKVTFDLNGMQGTGPDPAYVTAGNTVAEPEEPVSAEDLAFLGWYTNKSCSDPDKYDFASAVNSDLTLYAKWSDKYKLWVNGVQVGKDNRDTAEYSYDPAKKVLDLKNIVFSTDTATDGTLAYIYSDGIDLKITGSGSTSASASPDINRYGIYVRYGSLTLNADLTFAGTGTGIFAMNDILIEGGNINITSSIDKSGPVGRYKYPRGIYTNYTYKQTGGNVKIDMSGNGAYGLYTIYGDVDTYGGALSIKTDSAKASHAVLAGAEIRNDLCFVKPVDGKVDPSGRIFTDAYGYEAFEIELAEAESLNCIVSFDLNGKPGVPPAAQTVKAGSRAKRPSNPKAAGFAFDGWYKTAACADADLYDFSSAVNEDITLYARWTEDLNLPSHSALDPVPEINAETTELWLVKGQKFMIGKDWSVANTDSKKFVSISKKGQLKAKKADGGKEVKIKNGDREIVLHISKPVITTKKLTLDIVNASEKAYGQIVIDKDDHLDVLYYSASPDVATVDQSGKVTAVGKGKAKITAYINGSAYKCSVTVKETETALERTLHMTTGTSKTINVKIKDVKKPEWKSAADSIAAVDKKKVKAGENAGATYLTANANGVDYKINVFVENTALNVNGGEGITLNKKSAGKYELIIKKGKETDLFFEGVQQNVVFKSSKPDTVFIDENGHIYARNAGKGKFTAKINGKTVTISVKVTE